MAKSAREAALTVLERCRRDQAFSDALIGSVIQTTGLDSKDSALCTRLCYGVLQNMQLCDFYIDNYASKAQKLEPKVRDIMRLSVYQILFNRSTLRPLVKHFAGPFIICFLPCQIFFAVSMATYMSDRFYTIFTWVIIFAYHSSTAFLIGGCHLSCRYPYILSK